MIRIPLVTILLGLIFNPLFSQTKIIQGTVIDKSNREPVPYVHIFLLNSSSGTLTDVNGNFALMLNSSNVDSVRFSCIGYKSKKISIKNFISQKLTIELEEDRVLLPGLTVHALSAKELIRKSVSKIPDNYTQSKNERAFYWNSVRHDDKHTDFYEGYLRLSKNSKIFYDSTVADIETSDRKILIYDSLQDVLNFDVINKSSMFVNPANIDDWKFDYAYSSEHDGESFIIIDATMFNNPFKKGEDFSILKIYLHAASLAIVRIDFAYRWSGGQRYTWKDDIQFTVSRMDGTVEYVKNMDQYSFSYLFVNAEFSFMKRYNPAIFKIAAINHELVILKSNPNDEKPVVRWGDYLEATRFLSPKNGTSQD